MQYSVEKQTLGAARGNKNTESTMSLAQKQRFVVLEPYFSTKSCKRYIEIFQERFPNVRASVYELVERFHETSCVIDDRSRIGKPSILTSDFLQDIQL